MNKPCGLLGRRLDYSLSPKIHSQLGRYEYKLYEKSTAEEAVDFLKNGDYHAVNVTIPYKKTAFEICDWTDPVASKLKSINLVEKLEDGKLFGFNYDYAGFKILLESTAFSAFKCCCLVLGTGGAARTVYEVLADSGAKEVFYASRNPSLDREIRYSSLDGLSFDIVVNATPVGMFPHVSSTPLDLRRLKDVRLVVDLIYNPQETEILKQAKSLGIKTANGLKMLEEQARLSSKHMIS